MPHPNWSAHTSTTNLSPVLIPTLFKDMDEQLNLAHNVVDVWDQANRKTCKPLMRYSVNKAEISYAQLHLSSRKKDDKKFQQTVYVKEKIEEVIYLLDV